MEAQQTRVIRVVGSEGDDEWSSAIREAAEVLGSGGLVAFPTETVYGLGANATDAEAVRRIFVAKRRPATNPVIVHVADEAMARTCVEGRWPERAARLADRFWPGPLTMVLRRGAAIPPIVTAGSESVGVRVPDHRVARDLIAAASVPIAAPSANRSTGISATTAEHVLKDLDGRIALVLDAGPTRVGIESTVVDLLGERPRILRPGMISTRQMEDALGEPIETFVTEMIREKDEGFLSPGRMALHYAPRTATESWEVSQPRQIPDVTRAGLVVLGHPGLHVDWSPMVRVDLLESDEAAQMLYGTLHSLDEMGLERIFVIGPPDGVEWDAIRDRVQRASQRV